ncbi:MAG TPA: prepilin-type N-terminal cleavage/methylation domain-containing protein [Gemmatimonadaceae bacterium]|nr:prepilin-type N-terminal cleavage/methylation domain-containing protein [Gemmatimonadaceae bacterium]
MKLIVKSSHAKSRSAGFTLIEMIIAMTLIAITLALTVPFYRTQVQAFGSVSGRDDAHQNARYGVAMIDRELRVAGIGVVDPQPLVIQAGPTAITFSVDLVSADEGDVGAAYFNPDIEPGATNSLPMTQRITLPQSLIQYPDTNYFQQEGPLSAAETISFWVAPDTDPSAEGTHVLYRRVNNLSPTVVAKALILPPGEPVFRYFEGDTLGQLVEIPQNQLPIYHTARIHNSTADTGQSALTDRIRVVRVRLTGQFTDRDGVKVARAVETGVRIMNAGLLHYATCGEKPIFSSTVTAVASNVTGPEVQLGWNPSLDQSGGEKDVEQYSIYRRASTELLFGEPLASVPSGSPSYTYTDTNVQEGESWIYGIAARDCGGQSSSVAITLPVVVPAAPVTP